MRIDLQTWLFAIRSSFWPIPIMMSVTAIAAAFAVLEADVAFGRKDLVFPPAMTMPIESARLALSTIAGSMITIASLVFSMTLVALTMVSQQLGPRILLLFMDNRETQVMLGLFVATFIFALIVLLRVGDEETFGRVPAFAVIVTSGLAIFSLGMMVRFIHHIATRIQADVLIAELGRDLTAATDQFARLEQEENETASSKELREVEERLSARSTTEIALNTSGYLCRLDNEAACAVAKQNNLTLAIQVRPGEFVLAGRPILAVNCGAGNGELTDELQQELCALVSVADRRTPEASIEFEISALVEVALRALSPGINDPFTASACIDRLADGIRMLMKRNTEQRVSRDSDNIVRIVHRAEPFARYLSTAFDAIAASGKNNAMILRKLCGVLSDLEQMADDEGHADALKERGARIKHTVAQMEG